MQALRHVPEMYAKNVKILFTVCASQLRLDDVSGDLLPSHHTSLLRLF